MWTNEPQMMKLNNEMVQNIGDLKAQTNLLPGARPSVPRGSTPLDISRASNKF